MGLYSTIPHLASSRTECFVHGVSFFTMMPHTAEIENHILDTTGCLIYNYLV